MKNVRSEVTRLLSNLLLDESRVLVKIKQDVFFVNGSDLQRSRVQQKVNVVFLWLFQILISHFINYKKIKIKNKPEWIYKKEPSHSQTAASLESSSAWSRKATDWRCSRREPTKPEKASTETTQIWSSSPRTPLL